MSEGLELRPPETLFILVFRLIAFPASAMRESPVISWSRPVLGFRVVMVLQICEVN